MQEMPHGTQALRIVLGGYASCAARSIDHALPQVLWRQPDARQGVTRRPRTHRHAVDCPALLNRAGATGPEVGLSFRWERREKARHNVTREVPAPVALNIAYATDGVTGASCTRYPTDRRAAMTCRPVGVSTLTGVFLWPGKSAGKGTHRSCVAPGGRNADPSVIGITCWDVCRRPGHC